MFMPNGYEKPICEHVDYSGVEGLLCNMEGDSWERFPYPIIIDSGASASVMPTDWCAHVATKETEDSKNGQRYTAANGRNIFNEGETVVTMMSLEGHLRNMKFTACQVERAVGSVSAIYKQGHTIVSTHLITRMAATYTTYGVGTALTYSTKMAPTFPTFA